MSSQSKREAFFKKSTDMIDLTGNASSTSNTSSFLSDYRRERIRNHNNGNNNSNGSNVAGGGGGVSNVVGNDSGLSRFESYNSNAGLDKFEQNYISNRTVSSSSAIAAKSNSVALVPELVGATPHYPIDCKDVDAGFVGFANLPNQIHRCAVRNGFSFNLLVVGVSGMGKSTFINSLFHADIYDSNNPGPSKRSVTKVSPSFTSNNNGTKVDQFCYVLNERGVELLLTILDTPGFGDAVDNTNCWVPIIDCIETRYAEHMKMEHQVDRSVSCGAGGDGNRRVEKRIHACLYFIAPNGHGLGMLDVECLKRLSNKVNIIPIIAKADSLTKDECAALKKTLRNEFTQHQIGVYDFPEEDIALSGDESEQKKLRALRERMPFAVVGCGTPKAAGGTRCRTYPWGSVELENLDHNDFHALRTLLLRIHMQDLIESTERVHYESYRRTILKRIAESNKFVKDPLLQLEEERLEYERTLLEKEQEMEHVFEAKVTEKIKRLNDSEASNNHRIKQMQKQLHQEELEFEENLKQFTLDRAAWEASTRTSDPNSSPIGAATIAAGGTLSMEKAKTERRKKGLF